MYDDLESIEYGAGVQHYGHTHGLLIGRAAGRHLAWVEIDGLVLREEDEARRFVTSVTLRVGGQRFTWVNMVLGVLEGKLDASMDDPRARMYECRPEFQLRS